MVASIIPQFVPAFYSSMYPTALYGGLIVAFIGLIGIAMEKRDIQVLILTDIAVSYTHLTLPTNREV